MRVVVIGATGHIGSYLVPDLVDAGHHVVAVSRGQREPYRAARIWKAVERVTMDRREGSDDRIFAEAIARLTPEVVIDLICFHDGAAAAMVEGLQGRVQHLLVCGTAWIHGPAVEVPMTEDQARNPFGEYGVQKLAITERLERESAVNGFPATIIHPGHIVGPGWRPVNPAGHLDVDVFRRIARGDSITLPNIGMETLHHVHAQDVARLFLVAMNDPGAAIGESYHAVSPAALTLRGYAGAIYRWYGHEPRIETLPWEQWKQSVDPEEAQRTWDHIAHSPNCSMEKARRLLGFVPHHRSLDAIREALSWLEDHDWQWR